MQQNDTLLTNSGKRRHGGAYTSAWMDDMMSLEHISSNLQEDENISKLRHQLQYFEVTPSSAPVVFKVDSITSSLSSDSGRIIRPPCSKKRESQSNTKRSSSQCGDEDRNDENPVITLQKLMSGKARRTAQSSRVDPDSGAVAQQYQETPPAFLDGSDIKAPPSSRGPAPNIDIHAKRPVSQTPGRESPVPPTTSPSTTRGSAINIDIHAKRQVSQTPGNASPVPPPQMKTTRGSVADIDIRAKRPVNRTFARPVNRTFITAQETRKKPPIYQTIIEDTRYPKPQDTLDHVFNVLEHALCPNPQVSMKKDALDVICSATEKLICGPNPKYEYTYERKPSAKKVAEEERQKILLQQAIRDKHVLTNYPGIVIEGAKSPNYDIVVSAAEKAANIRMDTPKIIPPPSVPLDQQQEVVKTLHLLSKQNRQMLLHDPDNQQDFLDVVCTQVEAVTCNPERRYQELLLAQSNRQLHYKKDVLDVICQGIEHEICGRSLASEEVITFDPEEPKRQALQKLFKPPNRRDKKVGETIAPPALKNRKMPTTDFSVNTNSDTILPPAFKRKQATDTLDVSKVGDSQGKNAKMGAREQRSNSPTKRRHYPDQISKEK